MGNESKEWHPRSHPETEYRENKDWLDLGQVEIRATGAEAGLLVPPDKSTMETLNAVAARIYRLLDGTNTPEQIARVLMNECDVEYEKVLSDVYEFLGQLEKLGALEAPIPDAYRKAAGLGPSSEAT